MGIYCIWGPGQISQQCVGSQVFPLLPRVLYVDYEELRGFSFTVSPIYCSLQSLHCITYMAFLALQKILSFTVNNLSLK